MGHIRSDHLPVLATFNLRVSPPAPRPSWKRADWPGLTDDIQIAATPLLTPAAESPADIDARAATLHQIIQDALTRRVPTHTPRPRNAPYWNDHLRSLHSLAETKRRTWKRRGRPSREQTAMWTDQLLAEIDWWNARKEYRDALKAAKQTFTLQEVKDAENTPRLWDLHNLGKPKANKAAPPLLDPQTGLLAQSEREKAEIHAHALFPNHLPNPEVEEATPTQRPHPPPTLRAPPPPAMPTRETPPPTRH